MLLHCLGGGRVCHLAECTVAAAMLPFLLCRMALRQPRGLYSDAAADAAALYPSSGYLDDLAWGAAWLAAATGQAAYLRDAGAWAAAAAANASQAAAQPQACALVMHVGLQA